MDRGCGRLREAARSTIRSPPGEGKALKSGALDIAFGRSKTKIDGVGQHEGSDGQGNNCGQMIDISPKKCGCDR